MLQKFLLIGVGGSGGKTLRYIWRELDRRLTSAGWEAGIPDGWQFLHIDVPEYVDVIEGDVPADMGETATYLGLAEAPQEYQHYDRMLISRPDVLPGITGWRPDPTREYTSPFLGAGQRRAVGRVITLTQLDRIRRAVRQAVRALTSGDVDSQMREVGRRLGEDPNRRPADGAAVIVISSLGGGAGSGAFLDVIEVVRDNANLGAQWLDRRLLTVLYAADVFLDLDPEMRAGIEPNSLAALSELLSAADHEGSVVDFEQSLFALGGGGAGHRGRRTGRHTFIIGANNESISHRSSLHVFRSVGTALATFMVDDGVQHDFHAYLEANADGRAITPSFTLSQTGRCASFGYAKVSLGRSLFAEYATERLAKGALNRLLRGYLEGVEDAHLRSEKALIAEQVERARTTFFEESGLWEVGVDRNQVLDALRDREEIAPLLNAVSDAGRAEIRAGRRRKADDWRQVLEATFLNYARDFEQEAQAILHRRAQRWVVDIQQRVLATTAKFVGRQGLDVAVGLVVAVNDQVIEAAGQLRREREQLSKEGSDSLSNFRYLFENVKDKVVGSNHDDLPKAVQHQRKSLQRRYESSVCQLGAELLTEISSGLLVPLERALRKARQDLATSERSTEFASVVDQWTTGAMPRHLQAAPNEILLQDESEVPTQLNRLFDALADGAGAMAGESAAIVELVSGAWPSRYRDQGGAGAQTLIESRASWRPDNSAARPATEAPRAAAFDIQLTPATLERAAARWVRERRGPLADFVEETLAEWLSEDHPHAVERADRFADAFVAALKASAPLVSVNPDTHTAVHGSMPARPRLLISDVPIGPTHRAAKRVLADLAEYGVDAERAANLLNPNSRAGDIGLMTFMGAYVHPVVFDSLTTPIADDWRALSNAAERARFWSFRRARRLTSFAPLSQSRQRALVRGWLTAELLGHVDQLEQPWRERPLTVWTPRGRRTFPRWLLGDEVAGHADVLPALFESLPLALVTFGGRDEDDLNAYFRLIELGSAPGAIGAYDRANAELEGWIRTGTATEAQAGFEAAPVPDSERSGHPDALPRERAQAITRTLTEYHDAYTAASEAVRMTPEQTLMLPRAWEIRDLAIGAARDLIRAVEAIDLDTGGAAPKIAVPTSF